MDSIPAAGLAATARGRASSKTEIADRLGISRQHLCDILAENKSVSPNVAVQLGKLFGNGAGIWLRTRAAYDTWQAEQEVDISDIETIKTVA